MTAVLGRVLLFGLPIVMLSGLVSSAAYDPRLGGNVQLQGRSLSPLDFYLFNWPAHPQWLYALTQGTHISLALALIPVILVKQWSVLPRWFRWPPFRTPAHALERLSLVFLVGGIFFELITGLLFIEYWFPFHFNFTSAHYYGAWVFFAAFLLHAGLKLPRMREALRTRGAVIAMAHTDVAGTVPEPPDATPDSLVPVAPVAATISRRALLGTIGAGSLLLGVQGIAQDTGGPVRVLAFMLPRGSKLGSGPNDFPVNGTFAALGLSMGAIAHWRLHVRGPDGRRLELTRQQLLAMPQSTYRLPLACREGWSTTQQWTGVRLRELAAAVGAASSPLVDMTALDGGTATLAANQVSAEETMLALSVNGAPLSLDHGFPARVIVADEIAVNCLKWVDTLSFREADRA